MDTPIVHPNTDPIDPVNQPIQPEGVPSDIQSPPFLPEVIAQPILDREARHEARARRHAESEPRLFKARQFAGRVMLAAVCTIPVADLALSDAVGAKIYLEVNDHVQTDDKRVERASEIGINAGIIMAETIGLGVALSRRKKLQGVFGDFDDYLDEKQKDMSPFRKKLSQIINSPYTGLSKLGAKFEDIGEKLSQKKSKVVRGLGRLAIDTGKLNTLGSSTVLMQETMAGKPPGLKRSAYLGAIITTTWLGTAEGLRELYRIVPALQPPMDAMGKGFDTLTSLDNPAGIAALGAVALGLANSGWNIAKFHERKEAQLQAQELENQN